jgi:putative ABC transport system substrate-binding protein
MTVTIGRRELLAALGGAAVAWPPVVRAQQAERMRRIGVLTALAADDPESQARHAAFLQGLQEAGWSVGRNVRIDYRWGAGDPERIRKYAAELAVLAPDVILATGSPVTTALLQVTRNVAIAARPRRRGDRVNCSPAFGRPWRMKTISPWPISAFWPDRHAWQSSHGFLFSL